MCVCVCMFTWDFCLRLERMCRQEKFPQRAVSSTGLSSKQFGVRVCFGLRGQYMKRLLYLQWESEFDLSPCERWEGLIPSSDLSRCTRDLESVLRLWFLTVRLSICWELKVLFENAVNWSFYSYFILIQGFSNYGPEAYKRVLGCPQKN